MGTVKNCTKASTLKKVVFLLLDGTAIRGYLNPQGLSRAESVDLLTCNGQHKLLTVNEIKSIFFVREFDESYEPVRKAFLSRPKMDGLWVRLIFQDNEVLEGVVPNNLLDFLDSGVRLTPPDLHGNTFSMFIPRSALVEMTVLGVVGAARRSTSTAASKQAPEGQSKLFRE